MKKKIFLRLLFILCISLCLALASCGENDDEGKKGSGGKNDKTEDTGNFNFQLSEDGSFYTVIGLKDTFKEEIKIPNEYKGKPVLEIGSGAFGNCSKIKRVIIGEGITHIRDHAFVDCTSLESIALRESNPFGLKRKIACLTVLKKLDNSLIACTFLPCNPTYFLV